MVPTVVVAVVVVVMLFTVEYPFHDLQHTECTVSTVGTHFEQYKWLWIVVILPPVPSQTLTQEILQYGTLFRLLAVKENDNHAYIHTCIHTYIFFDLDENTGFDHFNHPTNNDRVTNLS